MRSSDWSSDVCSSDLTSLAMSLKINELCVNCDVCEPACPNQAISQSETIYVIDPARCTECVGHFDEPQCVVVCPVECIDPDPDYPEDRETLLAKLHRLQQAEGQPPADAQATPAAARSEEHTSELQSLMRNSYAVF